MVLYHYGIVLEQSGYKENLPTARGRGSAFAFEPRKGAPVEERPERVGVLRVWSQRECGLGVE